MKKFDFLMKKVPILILHIVPFKDYLVLILDSANYQLKKKGKGIAQFLLRESLLLDLISKIVAFRVKENLKLK